jgi:hypothetical protein
MLTGITASRLQSGDLTDENKCVASHERQGKARLKRQANHREFLQSCSDHLEP